MPTPETNRVYDWVRPLSTIYYDVDRCIYCGGKNNLGREHIIPYWMVGGHVIRNASCNICGKITGRFEDELSNTSFSVLRRRMRFQSRSSNRDRKNNVPPPQFELTVNEGNGEATKFVQAHEMPPIVATLNFPPAGILEGRTPLPALRPSNFPLSMSVMNIAGIVQSSNTLSGRFKIPFNPTNYMRLAAKIAHGFFSILENFPDFEPILIESILTGHYVSYFVGMPRLRPHVVDSGHLVSFAVRTIPPDDYYEYAVATISLFCNLGGPCFEVVTARRRVLRLGGDPSRAKYIPEIYGSEGKFESCILLIEAGVNPPAPNNPGVSA